MNTTCPNLAEVFIGYKTKVKSSEMPKITSSKDAETYLRQVWSPNSMEHIEESVILLLNRANKVLGWAKISTGGIAGTVVDPKIVFQYAIKTNASGIILSHNHPSGNPQPSETDKQLTQKIKAGAKLLDMSLIDHVIMTEENYFSFADDGIL